MKLHDKFHKVPNYCNIFKKYVHLPFIDRLQVAVFLLQIVSFNWLRGCRRYQHLPYSRIKKRRPFLAAKNCLRVFLQAQIVGDRAILHHIHQLMLSMAIMTSCFNNKPPIYFLETTLWENSRLQKTKQIHPRNWSWNLILMVSKRNLVFRGLIFRFHVKFQGSTLPETNIAPENRPAQKKINLPTIHFQVLC